MKNAGVNVQTCELYIAMGYFVNTDTIKSHSKIYRFMVTFAIMSAITTF